MENLAREYFGKPLRLLNEQEIIEIEEMMDNMDPYGSKPMARPDRMMAQEGGLMQASYGYDDAMGESFDEFLRLKKLNLIPDDLEFDEWLEMQDVERHMKLPSELRTMAQEGGLMQMADLDAVKNGYSELIFGKPLDALTEDELIELDFILKDKVDEFRFLKKKTPQPDRMMAQEGGLMDMGGMEKDYRNEGGFVPIGGQERADDVPARLSKNEFVFTADAVRAAGGGDIDKGAEVMENMMENLEKGGKVSEESQGLKGARDMFATAQRLEGVL